MTVLYMLTSDLRGTGEALRREHEREHEVAVIDLRVETDYGRVVAAIAAADRVICW